MRGCGNAILNSRYSRCLPDFRQILGCHLSVIGRVCAVTPESIYVGVKQKMSKVILGAMELGRNKLVEEASVSA